MKRSGYIQRKTRIKPANRKRKAETFRRAFLSVERVLWVKDQPCAVWLAVSGRVTVPPGGSCAGAIECAHVVSRGAGGKWTSVISLCRRHHQHQHSLGVRTFAKQYSLDLAAIAAELATRGPQE